MIKPLCSSLLLLVTLTACTDRERVNCPPMPLTKNKALRAETTITVDSVAIAANRLVADRCR
jgi:hypothetical protein